MTVEGKKTNLVRIPIGDEGGDGHNQFTNFDFRVPVEFTKEVLAENYKKNRDDFGFGLNDFANDYEDSSISYDKLEILISAGLEHEVIVNESIWNFNLSEKELFKIAIFFISRGLEGFSYEMVSEPDFTLFSGSETEYMIGYGLFFD